MKIYITKGKCKCGRKIVIKYKANEVVSKLCKCGERLYAPYRS